MVTEYISKAWSAYKKNFWQILGALVLFMVIIIALAFVSIVSLIPVIGPLSLTGITGSSILTLFNPYTVMVMAAIFLVMVLAMWSLGAGLVRVYADALGGKARLETMFSVAKKKFWTVAAANLAVLLLLSPLYILAAILSLSLSGAALTAFLAYFVLLSLPIILVAILFNLVEQAIVIDDCNALDSIKRSANTVKNNFLEFLGLFILTMIVSLAVSIIPFFGGLLNLFVAVPVIGMSYTAFYLAKTKPDEGVKTGKRKRGRKKK